MCWRLRGQAHLMSRQCHGWVRLLLKKITRINKARKRCNFISKEKLDSKYLCRGGLRHQLWLRDIHIYTWLWIKGSHIQKSGDKINLRNTKNFKTWTLWRVMKNENTSLKSFSNSLCSTNSTPSKDGGTCRRELIERKWKMHNLRTKCEKQKVWNTSIDGLSVWKKFWNTRKWGE
jgi:hypothetical protein